MLLHEHEYTVSEMCRVLGVSRQGYYQWRRRPAGAHALRDAELAGEIRRVFELSRGTYGSPRVFAQLRRDGVVTSEKRVARIMAERGWAGASRRRAKSPGGAEKRVRREDGADDLVGRDFTAGGPDQAWFADITYVRTRQGWLYLAVVMDIWSRMVVGWSMGERIDAALADDALRMAVERRRPPEGCVHHSDHGSQYASLLLGKTMRENGIRPSMGSVASPWDNAPTESLMGTIKCECVHARTFDSREQAALEIFEYIECFYNRLRLHSALGYMSPLEFEESHASQPLAA